ncbi:MAG: ABC transporter ATP-binding protein [Chloroflexi bacterium]|nr:ABC transporter ATP-binding protein [Chloroflexota bacterium]
MTAPLLAFHHIDYGYPGNSRAVLRALSLDIQAGTVTAILGPNGVGKTTLLHLALGWLKPQQGKILLDGKPLGSYPRRAVGQWMALIPQTEQIHFEHSILDYVLLGRTPYLAPLAMPGPEDVRIAERALERVGLEALRSRSITTLSGGERQLVLAARALVQQPRLLLLDEPMSHLDLANKARLIQLLRDLVAQGMTLLLTSHEPDVAAALATHIVLMHNGQVYRAGALADVFTSDNLSATYGIPVQVSEIDGRQIALWI